MAANGMDQQTMMELQQYAEMEQQRLVRIQQLAEITDKCWTRCMKNPSDSLSNKESTCFENCVERFVDVAQVIGEQMSASLSNAEPQ